MPLGSISFFFCHLLQRTSCQVQHSSPWMSYRDLFFWQKSCCSPNWSESLTISEERMGMNNIESYLSQFQHFSYNFSFMSSACLRKLYTCSFNTKSGKQHTFSLAGCSYVSEHTHRHEIQEQHCNIPMALNPPWAASLTRQLTQARSAQKLQENEVLIVYLFNSETSICVVLRAAY